MADYSFTTIWKVEAPIAVVWDLIKDADRWPEWWPGVLRSVEVSPGDANGVGSIRRTAWRSRLPYTLEFDSEMLRVEKHKLIEIRAFGELEGRGLWTFEGLDDGRTRVQYLWTVRTAKRWMNLVAPVARPLFRWNHDAIMRWGEAGLKRRIGG